MENNKWVKNIEFVQNSYLNFFKNSKLSLCNNSVDLPYKYVFIIGENGSGKTLFLNSLEYCLYGKYYREQYEIAISHTVQAINLNIILNDKTCITKDSFKLNSSSCFWIGKFEQFQLADKGSQLLDYLSRTINTDIDQNSTQYFGFSNLSIIVDNGPEILDTNRKEQIVSKWEDLGLYFHDFGLKIENGKKYICITGGTRYDQELELEKNQYKKYNPIYNSFSDGETSILNFSMINFDTNIHHFFYDEFGIFLNPLQKTKMINYLYSETITNNTQYFITTNSIITTASVVEHMFMSDKKDTMLLLFIKDDSGSVNIYRYAYDTKIDNIINLDNNESIFLLNPISINAINYKLFKVPNFIYYLELVNSIKDNDKYKKIKQSNSDNETLLNLAGGKEKILKIVNDFKYFKDSIFINSPEELILDYRNTIAHNKWNTEDNKKKFKFKYNDTTFLKQMIILLEEIFKNINNK